MKNFFWKWLELGQKLESLAEKEESLDYNPEFQIVDIVQFEETKNLNQLRQIIPQ